MGPRLSKSKSLHLKRLDISCLSNTWPSTSWASTAKSLAEASTWWAQLKYVSWIFSKAKLYYIPIKLLVRDPLAVLQSFSKVLEPTLQELGYSVSFCSLLGQLRRTYCMNYLQALLEIVSELRSQGCVYSKSKDCLFILSSYSSWNKKHMVPGRRKQRLDQFLTFA